MFRCCFGISDDYRRLTAMPGSVVARWGGDVEKAVSEQEDLVTCAIVVDNQTNYVLLYPKFTLASGKCLEKPSRQIEQYTRDAAIFAKTSFTPTGTSGTISWEIGGKRRRLVVMWSTPFPMWLHYGQWLAIGFSKPSTPHCSHNELWFNEMYNDNLASTLHGFKRGAFDRTLCCPNGELIYRDADLEVRGSMCPSNKSLVQITLRHYR